MTARPAPRLEICREGGEGGWAAADEGPDCEGEAAGLEPATAYLFRVGPGPPGAFVRP